jgi:plastocyanin
MMSKGLCAAAAAVLVVAAAGSGSARADHAPGGAKTTAACSPSGTALTLVAENHKYDNDCLAVTEGESFTIRFDNRDSDRHNVALLPSHTSTETIFAGDILAGPKSTVYAAPKMRVGTYHFHCEVHPNLMNGTFVVAAAPTPAAGAKPAATPPPMTSTHTPAATPTSAGPHAAAAGPAPKSSVSTAAPTPNGSATGAEAGTAVAGTTLVRTGPVPNRALLLLAGLALVAGGLSVLAGARGDAYRQGCCR